MPPIKFGQATDIGLQRTNNEDAVLSNPSLGLWLVADGMGGHDAGEVASQIAQDAIDDGVSKGHTLSDAVFDAHNQILKAAYQGIGKTGMGSTVVALHSNDGQYQIAWVGDSRAYLLDSCGTLKQLSTDHSYVQSLYKGGLISYEEMATHPDRNVITQCLGSTEEQAIEVDTLDYKWRSKDRIMLCSDGLTDYVSEIDVKNILHLKEEPQAAVDALVHAALDAGGRDNISVIVIDAPMRFGAPWIEKIKHFFRRH